MKYAGPAWYANGPWLYNIAIVLTLVYPIYWCVFVIAGAGAGAGAVRCHSIMIVTSGLLLHLI